MPRSKYWVKVRVGLLCGKHRRAMGSAVWEYLWLLRRVTVLNGDDGVVLGGKPIGLAEIGHDLELPRSKVHTHLVRLEAAGYILRQVSYSGTCFRVKKCAQGVTEKVTGSVTEKGTGVLPKREQGVTEKVTGSVTEKGTGCYRKGDTHIRKLRRAGGELEKEELEERAATTRNNKPQSKKTKPQPDPPTDYESRVLAEIAKIPNFRRDQDKNLLTIRELSNRYPKIDLRAVASDLGSKVRCGAYTAKNLVAAFMNWTRIANEKGFSILDPDKERVDALRAEVYAMADEQERERNEQIRKVLAECDGGHGEESGVGETGGQAAPRTGDREDPSRQDDPLGMPEVQRLVDGICERMGRRQADGNPGVHRRDSTS